MLLRLLRMLMEGDATRLRAPYVDTLSPPYMPLSSGTSAGSGCSCLW